MMRFLHVGTYAPGQVQTRQVPSTRRTVPEVESAIDAAWQETLARPGVRLFDGAVGRFEGFRVVGQTLEIDLSRTSYRVLVGTNFFHPEFASTYGPDVMANPIGVSTGLVTSDGYLMMGRRNASVAYYPDRVHPFAGSLEVREQIDLFDDVRRELREELALGSEHLRGIVCLGLAEDSRLLHPESIFESETTLTRAQIDARVHADEHHGAWSVPLSREAMDRAVRDDAALTPIARAVLIAVARHRFG